VFTCLRRHCLLANVKTSTCILHIVHIAYCILHIAYCILYMVYKEIRNKEV
jgi:hypothetical protein